MRLTRTDKAAMQRAIALTRAEGRGRRDQIDAMLRNEPWEAVGAFASAHCQTRALDLRPWMWPPVFVTDIKACLREPPDAPNQIYNAARLLKRMLAAGVSRYDPDPISALERAKANKLPAA